MQLQTLPLVASHVTAGFRSCPLDAMALKDLRSSIPVELCWLPWVDYGKLGRRQLECASVQNSDMRIPVVGSITLGKLRNGETQQRTHEDLGWRDIVIIILEKDNIFGSYLDL